MLDLSIEIKNIIKNYIIFKPKNNKELEIAVREWVKNKDFSKVKYGPISNWDTSLIKSMANLFDSLDFNDYISDWNVSNVENMDYIFRKNIIFNQPINKWNISNVKTMKGAFYRASNFNQELNNWDVSNVRVMDSMFEEANSFNQPLNSWNVSSQTDLDKIFEGASSFDIKNAIWNNFN